MNPRSLICAFALLFAAVVSSFGYVREFDDTNTSHRIPLAWVKDRTVVMQLSLGGLRALSDGFQSFNESARDALNTWNLHLAHLHLSPVMYSPVVPRDGDELMSVAFSTTVFGKTWGSGVLAITMLSYRNGNMEETDTLFNNKSYAWDSYRGPLRNVIDFHRVAMHEFGHTIGLDHPDQAQPRQIVNAIMNSRVSNTDTLQPDDINGVTSIYGSGPAYVSIPSGPVLMNLSTRGVTNTGNNVLIGGFIVQGSQPAAFIIRSLGYSLAAARVPNPLSDSVIELYDGNNHRIATNDDWFVSTDAPLIASYRLDPPDSIESAIIATLNPGRYTVIVRSYSDSTQPAGTGIALFEVYDLRKSTSRAANVSSRGHVGIGDNILIGGFIIGGASAKPVIIRALGPTLTASNVTGVLADPYLELRDTNGNLLEANDNWQQSSQANQLIAASKAPPNPTEAAIAPTLSPGKYTVLVRGAGGTTGTALVEIYDESPP